MLELSVKHLLKRRANLEQYIAIAPLISITCSHFSGNEFGMENHKMFLRFGTKVEKLLDVAFKIFPNTPASDCVQVFVLLDGLSAPLRQGLLRSL